MNQYVVSAFIAFVLVILGTLAIFFGYMAYNENKESKSGINILFLMICTFIWNFGYAWMCLCYDSDFAYIARALALAGVYIYCFFLLKYISSLVEYDPVGLKVYGVIYIFAAIFSWIQIIGKDAVTFTTTPWGYWYISKVSWGRIIQFVLLSSVTLIFYYVLIRGINSTNKARIKYVYKHYLWYGPILYAGYIIDTLIPSIFHIPAIPASSVGAFFSTFLLYKFSKNYKAFGISKDNVSEYVFQDVNIPVIIADSENKIALYNDSVISYFDTDNKDIIGMDADEFVYSSEPDENGIVVRRFSDDSVVEYKLSKTRVNDRFGELLYTVIFVQDTTAEQINLRALEESRIEAENANMAKSNFLANMSHEIRTPMNAILGMSELILQNYPESNVADEVKGIKSAARNLLGIINDILDISKIEAGRYEIIPDDYTMSSLVNDVSNIARVRVQESGVKFVLDIDPSVPENVYGDALRIRQLLLNLIGNASKFTKQGAITFKIWWNNKEDDPELYFDVSDTGIGIKEEDIEKIFGEFSQVDTRKNRSVQGTGLGLAISRNLARLMQGDITVFSKYGEGSTFHVSIKQVVEQYKPVGKKVCDLLIGGKFINAKNEISETEIKRPNAKVLVVDDVEINLVIAQGMLKKYDIDADIAFSGKEAVELVTNKDYDLIFMDHMMPELDGVDTTNLIRQIPKEANRNTVVVALTANAVGDARETLLNAGMQDFLSKPIDPSNLDQIILKWL